jgi:hypothetical protein
MRKLILIIVLLLVSVLVLAACEEEEGKQVKIAKDYISAMKKGDKGKLAELTCPGASGFGMPNDSDQLADQLGKDLDKVKYKDKKASDTQYLVTVTGRAKEWLACTDPLKFEVIFTIDKQGDEWCINKVTEPECIAD